MQVNSRNILYDKNAKNITRPIQELYLFMADSHERLLPPQIDQLNNIIETLEKFNRAILQECAK